MHSNIFPYYCWYMTIWIIPSKQTIKEKSRLKHTYVSQQIHVRIKVRKLISTIDSWRLRRFRSTALRSLITKMPEHCLENIIRGTVQIKNWLEFKFHNPPLPTKAHKWVIGITWFWLYTTRVFYTITYYKHIHNFCLYNH